MPRSRAVVFGDAFDLGTVRSTQFSQKSEARSRRVHSPEWRLDRELRSFPGF
ncbi:hypothetical protein [Oxynema aestuarii]|uniref:hypothetical protein n=1 Tax=Oxynema aestuarii TaxID=2874213 RepID=UPI001B300D31|nr:hypothetical protein [Oxynema aestuarii]